MRQDHEHLQDEGDVEAILHLALRKQGDSHLLRERLQATANELGIPPQALAEAEKEYLSNKRVERERREFDEERRREFWTHLTAYIIVNLALVGINIATGSGHFWAVYPILGWGIGLAFHAAETFHRGNEDYQKDFARWQRRRRKRLKETEDDDEDDD